MRRDGLEGIGKFREKQFDLVILDLMLPGMSGIDVCREIRRSSSAPIIMVTAKSGEDDIVAGLDAGGRRLYSEAFFAAHPDGAHQGEPAQERHRGGFRVGAHPRRDALVIDPQNLTVKKNGEEVSLTRNEFMILSKMAARPDKTWSRDDLITYALGYEYDGFERSIDSYIKNIRKKLSDPGARERLHPHRPRLRL